MNATVFLGGGRITSALVAGLHQAGYAPTIVVHDRHAEKMRELRKTYNVQIERDLHRALNQAGLLVVAVRPDGVKPLLKKIGIVNRPLIAVSLAAGIPLAKLKRWGPGMLWARAMPSPACRTRNGLTAVTFDRGMPQTARRKIRKLFSMVGPILEIPERQFDAFTVTYSSSHGYHALATLAQAAQALGLDRKTALLAASHALADGILAWRESNDSLDDLLYEAATPGGIAATVMSNMEMEGYRRLVRRALAAGIRRARKNANL